MRRADMGKAVALVGILLAVVISVAAPQGTPPQITYIDSPEQIQAGESISSYIFFEDPDGDVAKVTFELLEGERSALEIKPDWEFDPEVKGETEGVIEFQVAASSAGDHKLRVTLEDEEGNTSEPLEFAFEAVSTGPSPQPCAVTVDPGESIQQRIDVANPGDVICLSAGEWQENLVIGKGLTLRGAGREQSVIKDKEEGRPVVRIESESEIEVTIAGLTIAEAKVGEGRTGEEDGIRIGGKAKVIVWNSKISGNDWNGIWMGYSSQARIFGSEISGNVYCGIAIEGSSQAEISGSKISGNGGWGIEMRDSSQATISGSQISGNGRGGILIGGSSRATISGSQISGNGEDGIRMWGSSQTTISGSQLSGNDFGIWMEDSSQATIRANKIFENKRYGVVLWQRPCYDTDSVFKGKVEGSGNEIHDNGEGDVCPEELEFLMTEEGGCYGPLCE